MKGKNVMKKRLVLVISLLLSFMLFATACDMEETADEKDQQKQEQMQKQAGSQLGMPNIINFQEKKLMKQVMELCDKSDLVCYVYTFSEYTGKYNYVGKCIGFGLPYGTEYTNPQKLSSSGYHDSTALPQADPNGLFKPADVNATWICMIDDATGEKYILYNEPNITISAHKLPKSILNKDGIPSDY